MTDFVKLLTMCYKIQKFQGGNTDPPALVRFA